VRCDTAAPVPAYPPYPAPADKLRTSSRDDSGLRRARPEPAAGSAESADAADGAAGSCRGQEDRQRPVSDCEREIEGPQAGAQARPQGAERESRGGRGREPAGQLHGATDPGKGPDQPLRARVRMFFASSRLVAYFREPD